MSTVLDNQTRRHYERLRNDGIRAKSALAIARMLTRDYGWEETGHNGRFEQEVEGFKVVLTVDTESVYPMEGDGLGHYVDGRYNDHDAFVPDEETPLGLPAGIFRYDDVYARTPRWPASAGRVRSPRR